MEEVWDKFMMDRDGTISSPGERQARALKDRR